MSKDRAEFNDTIRDSPFASLLGTTVEKLGKGYARCSVPMDEDILNSHGTVHGGVHFSLADTTAAIALLHALEQNSPVATIEGKINYLASVRGERSDEVYAEAEVDHVGSETAVVSGEVFDDSGRLLCKALFTFTVGEDAG